LKIFFLPNFHVKKKSDFCFVWIFFPEHYDNLLYTAFDFFSREFPYISAINLTLLIFVRNNSKISSKYSWQHIKYTGILHFPFLFKLHFYFRKQKQKTILIWPSTSLSIRGSTRYMHFTCLKWFLVPPDFKECGTRYS
jgi:hypothetical protein